MYPEGTKFLVIEIQKNAEGIISNLALAFDDLPHAEAKFYTLLATVALSNVPKHSVTLLHEEGYVIRNETYEHS